MNSYWLFNTPVCIARGTETNVWDIKRERNKFIKAGFPRELIKRILNDFVPKGSTVLDPFMGSCTCGLVCQELGYDFIGIEADEEMFQIARERIEEETDLRVAKELIIDGVYDERLFLDNRMKLDKEKMSHRIKAYLQHCKIHIRNGDFINIDCDTIHFSDLEVLKKATKKRRK